ncbi:MAG: hypothetical protein JW726_07420 [Anaerolineales bacterium]|nr:hypothetical protein [Anaerolineales bacterium]
MAISDFNYGYGPRRRGDLVDRRENIVWDLMNYKSSLWLSPFTWESWINNPRPPDISAQYLTINNEAPDYLYVSGWVSSEDVAGFNPVWKGDMPISPPIGDYCIHALDNSGIEINSVCFAINFSDPESGNPTDVGYFLASLPYNLEISQLQLTHNGSILNGIVANSPPTVTLTHPNNGGILAGDLYITWTGFDANSDPLHYRVLFSPDYGSTWNVLASNLTGSTYLVDVADLQGTGGGLFRVMVSDGFSVGEDQSDAYFSIAGKPPVLTVSSLLNGGSGVQGSWFILSVSVYDKEDGLIPPESISWMSDIDGLLGTGNLLEVVLSPGIHLITVTAADQDGMVSEEGFYAEVLSDTDNDGMPDRWEASMGLNSSVDDALGDPDNEGLTNFQEYLYGTDPFNPDTDFDGWDDYSEFLYGSPPPEEEINVVHLPLVHR